MILGLCLCQAEAQDTDSLDIMIGQMIFVGIGDRQVLLKDDSIVRSIASQKVGGIILYEKNLRNTETSIHLHGLITMLQQAAAQTLWIGIDEEGGKVNRLRPKYGFMTTLSAYELSKRGVSYTFEQAQEMAKQLKELGINVNFAPVVDLALNSQNNVIVKNGRSFGSSADSVAKHASAFIYAHQSQGLMCVPKHFPGHGSSLGDTHVELTDITQTWQLKELLPYSYLIEEELLYALMSAHIIHTFLDPKEYPATLSQIMLSDLLKGTMRYKGLIFSDDLHMLAIAKYYTLEQTLLLAIQAGVDVLLFSNHLSEHQSAEEIHALIKTLVVEGQISQTRIQSSYQKIVATKRAFGIM